MQQDLFDALKVLNEKLNKLLTAAEKEIEMLEELRAKVERNREVDESVKVLLTGLKTKLDELAARPTVDPAELAALSAELGTSTEELAAAVAANTVAE